MERLKSVWFAVLCVEYVVATTQSKYSPPVIKNVTNQEIVVDAKGTISLLCEGNEKITWTYPKHTIEGIYWSTVDMQTKKKNGKHFAKLTLSNASYVDVDYYYCHEEDAAITDIQRSTKVYIFVRDEDHLSALPVDDIVFITANPNSKVILPCRPTAPDVSVSLLDINEEEVHSVLNYGNHIGYEVQTNSFDSSYVCTFSRNGAEEELTIVVTIILPITEFVPKPNIDASNNGITKIGDTYVLNCTVTVDQNIYFTLDWTTPNPAAVEAGRITVSTASAININDVRIGSRSLTIKDVHFEDKGVYTCIVTDHTHKNNSVTKNITVFDPMKPIIYNNNMNGTTIRIKPGYFEQTFYCNASGFPHPEITWRKDNQPWVPNNNRIEISPNNELIFKNVKKEDAGVYACRASNSEGFTEKTMKLDIIE